MPTKPGRTVLFLQLPLLDCDLSAAHENLPAAAQRLAWSARRQDPEGHWRFTILPQQDTAGNDRLLDAIVRRNPCVIAATLYLWNVERTLALLARIRQALPATRIVAGGPEVAADHPFLFESRAIDAVVTGEGENVFAALLRAIRNGRRTDFTRVAWRTGGRWTWGRQSPEPVDLARDTPPPTWPLNRPDRRGMAYIEAGRGCPMRCSFCRYGQERHRLAYMAPERIESFVRVLVARGAREIRFVDPTFNAHPAFEEILARLAWLNRRQRIRFFAEIRADTITVDQAHQLRKAGFHELEVGVQSLHAGTLAAVRRPARTAATRAGIRRLAAAGARLTVDLMCGLPRQNLHDIRADAHALLRCGPRSRIDLQFLHTLLLPGTPLRTQASELGLQALPLPPYRVTRTPWMAPADIIAADRSIAHLTRTVHDTPIRKQVGSRLADLFPHPITVRDLSPRTLTHLLQHAEARQAIVFDLPELFPLRTRLAAFARRCVETSPHTLWQFVTRPRWPEPLDVWDELVAALQTIPDHVLDRMNPSAGQARPSRGCFVWLPPRFRAPRGWRNELDRLLIM